MKISIQTKLLLPSLATLFIVILGSSLWVSNMITSALEASYIEGLTSNCTTLFKGVQHSAIAYKERVRAMAKTARLASLANILAGEESSGRENATQAAQQTLEDLKHIYPTFAVINIAGPDGLVVAGTNKAGIGKVNVSKREYFQSSMTGDTVFSEPLMSMDINDKAVVISTPLPSSSGKVAGVLYVILPCSYISRDVIGGITIGQTGFAFIADEKGRIVAHPESKYIQETDLRTTDWGRKLLQSPKGMLTYSRDDGVNRFLVYQLDSESGCYAITSLLHSEIEEKTSGIRNISVAMLFIGAVFIALILFLTIRPVVAGLRQGASYTDAVAGGNLEQEFTLRRNDELGVLFDGLRYMVSGLKKEIGIAKQETEHAREATDKAEKAMRSAEAAGREAQAKTEVLLDIANRLEEMGSVVSSASTELSAQIEQSDRGASETAHRLEEAATAMNEMNATVQEVARNASSASAAAAEAREKAVTGSHIVERSLQCIETVHQNAQGLKNDMAQLDEHARAISQIMGVISDIADQTNLLALNAAIEAARAGEAGRGFAVVADEVRKLAEKTMASTQDVGRAIKAIQESTEQSVAAVDTVVTVIKEATKLAGDSGQALKEIVSEAEVTADQVNSIATASEEQSAASEEINQSILQCNDMTAQIAAASHEAAKAVAELARETQGLAQLINEMKRA